MSKRPRIRFRPNLVKAVEVILWLARARLSVGLRADMHAILKLLYFAEEFHLNSYGRPIVGDRFYARQFGPVPELTYDLLKAEPLAVQELANGELPFERLGTYEINPIRNADLTKLSESDVEALEAAFQKYGRMNFHQLTETSHATHAYRAAEDSPSQLMDYADFLVESEGRADLIIDLADISHRLRA